MTTTLRHCPESRRQLAAGRDQHRFADPVQRDAMLRCQRLDAADARDHVVIDRDAHSRGSAR